MKTIFPIFPVVITALAMGCATAKVESVVDKTVSHKINEIYLVSDGPSKYLSEKFVKLFSEKLNEIGITNEFIVASLTKPKQLSLEPDSRQDPAVEIISNATKKFVLIINMNRVRTKNNVADHFEIEMLMFSKLDKKFIWKSNVTNGEGLTGPGTEGALMKEIINKTILQLKTDGLL